MDGFEFSINHFNKSWLSWATLDLEATEENGDLVNDAIYRRNRSIEERFDCKININEVDQIGGNEIQAEVMATPTTMSGSPTTSGRSARLST